MNQPEKISAEVLLMDLRDNDLEIAREKASNTLSQLGIDIVASGQRSISIECTPNQFESTFKCSVKRSSQSDSPGIDFGPVSSDAFTTDQAPSIPEQLSQEVKSIEIQIPPSLF
ncbi:hypothetical protein [uncultured Gimesia sp.]|uniref:hypothetical protein n=1 Tax=uncultured Gimesia sp. TaxID=1678688 RepID=UPI002635AA29|nr:hypothetical protein [uncultured Gimesia sp.]